MSRSRATWIIVAVVPALAAAAVVLWRSGALSRTPGANGTETSEAWRTDRPPLEKRFPELGAFDRAMWQGGTIGEQSALALGPTEYWIKAFVVLSKEDADRLEAKYHWANLQRIEDDMTPPKDLGVATPEQWKTSDDFSSAMKGSSDFRVGTVAFDPRQRLVFLYLETQ